MDEPQETIAAVTRAMLSMQRASWEHGVATQAMLETGNDELVYLMAQEAALRQTADGRLAVVYTDNGATDPGASGEGVLHAARIGGDSNLAQAAQRMLDYLLHTAPRSPDGVIYHTIDSPEIWSDSIYMAPPFLAVAGAHAEAVAQVDGITRTLWDTEARLYRHRWHDGNRTFISRRFWGGGNGWAAAGLARVIAALPPEMKPDADRLASLHRNLIDGCLAHLRPDGFFHDFVNEPDTFVETNLSQMLAYSIFRAVGGGWLADTYLESARRMRAAACSKVDGHGFVIGVSGAPSFDAPGRSTEGQAFFLLMEAASRDLGERDREQPA
jgi:unsaturated rhamnogalacturonyl hydrolase